MRVWIDDLRPPPGDWAEYHHVWAKTSEQAIEALARCKAYETDIEEISFDHDLGVDDDARAVVYFMIENFIRAGRYSVHTANPVGREWLTGMIERYLDEPA